MSAVWNRVVPFTGVLVLFNVFLHFEVMKRWTSYHSLAAGLAVLVVLCWFIFNLDRFSRQHRSHRAVRAGSRWMSILAVLAIAVSANLLAIRFNARLDTTPGGYFSLSAPTLKMLRSLDRPVVLHAFAASESVETTSMLHNFAMHSPWVRWEIQDAGKDPATARRFGVGGNGRIAVESGERIETVSINEDGTVDEMKLSSAVMAVREPIRRKVYFTTGHGETLTAESCRIALELLGEYNFDWGFVNLAKGERIPVDCRVLLVGGPEQELGAEAVAAVKVHLQRGGGLLVFLNPPPSANLSPLLAEWGIRAGDDVVIDPREGEILLKGTGAIPKGIEMSVVESFSAHPVTAGLKEILLFPIARSLARTETRPAGVFSGVLAALNVKSAWGETDMEALRQGVFQYDAPADTASPLALAVFADGTEGRVGSLLGRIVAVGSADFLMDRCMSPSLSNGQFFVRSVLWLSREDRLLEIRGKAARDVPIRLQPQQENLFVYFVLAIYPQLPLVVGAFIYFRRRRGR